MNVGMSMTDFSNFAKGCRVCGVSRRSRAEPVVVDCAFVGACPRCRCSSQSFRQATDPFL